jgi:hypothetical protein
MPREVIRIRPPVFSGVRVTRALVLCVCFVDRCLSFCPFSFGHCVVCPSLIYGFWWPLSVFKLLWPKEKGQKDKQRSTKHTHKTKDRVTWTPLKTGTELRCSTRVRSSCSTSGPCRVTLVANPVEFWKCFDSVVFYDFHFILSCLNLFVSSHSQDTEE